MRETDVKMVKKTGSSNPHMRKLIEELKKKAIVDKAPLWKRLATDLEKSTRARRIVNLSRINRNAKENETVIVPGKVLGSGLIDRKVTVVAYSFSDGAVEKLKAQKCNMVTISEFMGKSPKTSDVRIIG